jgi:hypothetical protein
MTYITDVYCPSNGLRFASFYMWGHYYYRLENGITFPLQVAYAWCHRCEDFVECERLYSTNEIQEIIDRLNARGHQQSGLEAQSAAQFTEATRGLAADLEDDAISESWVAALTWRRNRKAPPRCLKCGSFFAIKVLPLGEEVPHPTKNCSIVVGGVTHACVYEFPSPIFFDAEGVRIEHVDV